MTERQYENFLDIAGPVSRETFNALKEFEKSFAKWAQKINLSSASTLDDVWGRHILDSAQLFPLVPGVRQWLDLGAGGGFPGLVVALMLRYERPDCRIDLVESNRKKAGFLQAMTGEYRLPARVHAVRIENAVAVSPHVDVVTARALAPLPLLLRLASPWLTKGATGLFHKGRDYRQELEESADEWQFDLVEHPSKTDAHGVILEIRSLAPSGLALAKPFNIKAL